MGQLTSSKTAPRVSNSAFWDIDLSKLDFDRYADFTIIRVFERGTADDIHEIISYYGTPAVLNTITKAPALQPRALALGKKIFDLSDTQFACSKPSPQVMSYSRY